MARHAPKPEGESLKVTAGGEIIARKPGMTGGPTESYDPAKPLILNHLTGKVLGGPQFFSISISERLNEFSFFMGAALELLSDHGRRSWIRAARMNAPHSESQTDPEGIEDFKK
jgi:hypothetical protein